MTRTNARTHLEAAVLAALADRAPQSGIDLASSLEEHPVAVDQACTRLHDEGYVRSVSCGTYAITVEGRRRLADRTDGQQQQKRREGEVLG